MKMSITAPSAAFSGLQRVVKQFPLGATMCYNFALRLGFALQRTHTRPQPDQVLFVATGILSRQPISEILSLHHNRSSHENRHCHAASPQRPQQ
jgi:hypothetical protein